MNKKFEVTIAKTFIVPAIDQFDAIKIVKKVMNLFGFIYTAKEFYSKDDLA